jgi:hypothetical protein
MNNFELHVHVDYKSVTMIASPGAAPLAVRSFYVAHAGYMLGDKT